MLSYILAGSIALIVIVIVSFIRSFLKPFESYTICEECEPELAKRRIENCPPPYPNGWLPILEAGQLKNGQCKSVSALGNDFVVFRGTSGKVHVLDAYCPHLGANLGVGGTVIGDQIKCAFHGWQFNEEGQTTFIPGVDLYAKRVSCSVKIKTYKNVEINDYIFIWNHAEGKDPDWFLEEHKELENMTCRSKIVVYANTNVQDMAENTADGAHFTILHDTSNLIQINNWFIKALSKVHKLKFKLDWKPCKEPETHTGVVVLNVDHTFFGFFQMKTLFTLKNYGLGYIFGTFQVGNYKLPFKQGVITLGPLRQRISVQFYSDSSIIGIILAKLVVLWHHENITNDAIIWNKKTYIPNPPFVKYESDVKLFRHWAKQFYS